MTRKDLSWLALVLALPACKTPAAAPAHPDAAHPDARVAAETPAPAAAVDAAPERPLLEVRLPAAPASGAPAAKAVVQLQEDARVTSRFGGVSLVVGSAPPRKLALGERVELTVPASTDHLLRFAVLGTPVLAPVRPGQTLLVIDDPDGGWVAEIAERQLHNAPAKLTRCGDAKMTDCPRLYLRENLQGEDGVCPPREDGFKCVAAPSVRLRAASDGPGEVSDASTSGRFDDVDDAALSTKAMPVAIGGERLPLVKLGSAEAYLVLGPGESWQVWKASDGSVDAALSP